ncbi:MAG TPA: redox-sensing transcriptional repressor Rex [Bacteroidales bacterium]|nr:redox-sensing transcriptional repressor Rex [Bacteroidales bacterium]HPE57980.1 redox-sensing transcriptional repressor Rex [Bacteroidales bacterium]HPR57498.1 redox-sensing transcriptional repressor Rex [Bacteroidales bacterium]
MYIPDKTIERLSQYRRNLLICLSNGKDFIFSHEIAQLLHITPVQVRRDIMLIGYNGTLRRGYDVKELVELIGKIIDTETGQNVCIMGLGNLGKAILKYFSGKRPKLRIVAAFDVNTEKTGKLYAGVPVYHIDELENKIKEHNISIGIITVPPDKAVESAEYLVKAGINGILNFTSKSLNLPDHVYLEEYDMITSLEKVAYHTKKNLQYHE